MLPPTFSSRLLRSRPNCLSPTPSCTVYTMEVEGMDASILKILYPKQFVCRLALVFLRCHKQHLQQLYFAPLPNHRGFGAAVGLPPKAICL